MLCPDSRVDGGNAVAFIVLTGDVMLGLLGLTLLYVLLVEWDKDVFYQRYSSQL